jgi:hypothetical protein
MWLNISFSPSEHYALGAASSHKREAACGPHTMTGRRLAEEQNLSDPIAPIAAIEQTSLGVEVRQRETEPVRWDEGAA